MTISSTPGRRFCRFLTILVRRSRRVAGHSYLHRADVGQDRLGAFAVAGVAAGLAGRIVLVKADYKQRNTVERCINRLKQWRGIATRYEKTAIIYLTGLHVAGIFLWSAR
jgi:hypothetical protein